MLKHNHKTKFLIALDIVRKHRDSDDAKADSIKEIMNVMLVERNIVESYYRKSIKNLDINDKEKVLSKTQKNIDYTINKLKEVKEASHIFKQLLLAYHDNKRKEMIYPIHD